MSDKPPANEPSKQRQWVTLLAAAFAGGLFASVATIATGYLTFSNRDRELDLQLINISLGILRGEHEAERVDDAAVVVARTFAVRTITRLANTPLTEDEIKTWAEGGVTPFNSAWYDAIVGATIHGMTPLSKFEWSGSDASGGIIFTAPVLDPETGLPLPPPEIIQRMPNQNPIGDDQAADPPATGE